MMTGVWKRRFFLLVMVLTAALSAPLAAQARAVDDDDDDDVLMLAITPPFGFFLPSGECPEGTLTFGLAAGKRTGSGASCIQSFTPVAGDPLRQVVATRLTLQLRTCTIGVDLTIFETFAADFSSLRQVYEGTVTSATGRCRELDDAPVSGGGTIVFGPDGSLIPVNLVIVIGEGDDD